MRPMDYSNAVIEKLIAVFRGWLTQDFFSSNEDWLLRSSAYSTPVAAAIGLAIGIVGAIKTDSFVFFAAGLLWVVVIAICYYLGSRFLGACNDTIRNNPSTISNREFLNAAALSMIFAVVAILIGSIYVAIKFSSMDVFNWAIPLAIGLLYYICLFMNPQLISLNLIEGASAGEDALAILILFNKAALKLAGVIFGSMTLIGVVLMTVSLIKLASGEGGRVILGGLQSIGGAFTVVAGLLYPFVIYLSFIFVYLVIDLCKAILSLRNLQPK